MNEDILKKMEQRLGRRSFLRGSGLAAAGFLGVAAASTLVVFAQPRDQGQDKKKDDDRQDGKKKPDQDSDSEDPLKKIHYDNDGNPYRECPQCGHNMYQQGRTWTCENCGYSYIE